jgi:act minimal PKS acyl carrier protein
MTTFTEENLKKIMIDCVSGDESVDLDREIRDVPFIDLGYDSLLVLEIIGRLKRDHGIDIPDEAVADLRTPGQFLAAADAAQPSLSGR